MLLVLCLPSSQVCQPCHCASLPPPIEILLQEHGPHQPLHRPDAPPFGFRPEDGRLAVPAVRLPTFQQDPERPGRRCLWGKILSGHSCSLLRWKVPQQM